MSICGRETHHGRPNPTRGDSNCHCMRLDLIDPALHGGLEAVERERFGHLARVEHDGLHRVLRLDGALPCQEAVVLTLQTPHSQPRLSGRRLRLFLWLPSLLSNRVSQ